eukprot:11207200-Alexandrium_andersonii.AAC.1
MPHAWARQVLAIGAGQWTICWSIMQLPTLVNALVIAGVCPLAHADAKRPPPRELLIGRQLLRPTP